VRAQRVPFGQRGVFEHAVGGHAEPLHDGLRAQVQRGGEGHDLLQAEALETHAEGATGGFQRVALAPIRLREPPADFHAGRERQIRSGDTQSDEADE